MPFDAFVTATVETALNNLISNDPDSQRRLARLKGKVIRVRLNEISKQLVFVFSQQVDVLADFDGEPDCHLSVNLVSLPKLKEKANITRLIKDDQLILEGDIELAQQFSNLLSGLNIDIAEKLSRYTGDVIAHTLVSHTQSTLSAIKSIAERKQKYAGELLIEEWRVAPGSLEIAHFADQVDDVRSQAARVESRINNLIQKAESA